jgi:hypothetical protein
MGKPGASGSGAGLEGLLKGLKLSEEERNKVKGTRQKEGDDGEQAPKVVGKLFVQKAGNADGLAQALGRIWCLGQRIQYKELGQNLFLFTFLQVGGRGEPSWRVHGSLGVTS